MAVNAVLGDWLAARLRALGVRRVYGAPIRGLPHAPVRDKATARLLAATDGRVLGGLGAAFDREQVLYLGSAPGVDVPEHLITSAQQLAQALDDPPGLDVPGGAAYRIALLLDEPAPCPMAPSAPAPGWPPALISGRVVVLAGPGAVRRGHASAVQEFSERMGIGVLATWGGLGVLPHDHPHFLGVVGLQERDLVLGLAGAEQVLWVGVDPSELYGDRPSAASVAVRPETLAEVTSGWGQRTVGPASLAHALARGLAPLQAGESAPVHAVRACTDLDRILPADAVIAADAGLNGFWAVRTLSRLRSSGIVVPAGMVPGFAAASALVCGLAGRTAVGISSYPVDAATAEVVEAARTLNAKAVVLAWGVGAPDVDSTEHEGVVRRALARSTPVVCPLGVAMGSTASLSDVAGPIAAWPTLVADRSGGEPWDGPVRRML